MNDNKTTITALVFACLMFISPMAGAASVTTFSDGSSEVTVEVRDGPEYTNIVDGTVTLPSGDTVTSASVKVSTDMATHEDVTTVNSDTRQFAWDPYYNNQQTEYSNQNLFTYDKDTVSLVSGGFSTDFERTEAGFFDDDFKWQHGTLGDGTILNDNCNTGNDCWGTNIYDFDNDYTNDEPGSFDSNLISPAMEVDATSPFAYFSSWHGLHWYQSGSGTSTTNTFYDCGYVMVRNNSSPTFGPPNDPLNVWTHVPFDIGKSSGVGYSSGLYPIGFGNNRIQNCGSLTGTDYALGGESTNPSINPTGWAELALNLSEHAGRYVQLKFVMEHNSGAGAPANTTMPGWFIDDFRLGNALPQSGWMTVKGFTPKQNPNPGFPDGYGILTLEQETTPTNSLTVTVLRGGTSEIVLDKDGNQMAGLEGPIIELWGIDSSEYPNIDLRFYYDTGQYRLSTAVLHGLSIGTRIGTGLNDTGVIFSPEIRDGVWYSPGNGEPIFYQPTIIDDSYTPAISRTKFSQPIVGVTPVVLDNCTEDPMIELSLRDETSQNVTVDQKWSPSEPIFGFSAVVSYSNPCELSELWFDLEFGHSSTNVEIDIADDGDVEWAVNQPAFGAFGRQNNFWAGAVSGVNYAMDESMLALNINGEAVGGNFMLPLGADVQLADVILSNNTIGEFDLYLTASGQDVSLGMMPNQSILAHETMYPSIAFKDAINSLMTNPLLQASYIDDYGNEWATFQFKVSNENASSGAEVLIGDLDIVYTWETTLSASDYLDRELNQGIALGTGNQVAVPIAVSADTGGAVMLSDLAIVTAGGYDSTLELTGNPQGLYPNGDIIEAVSTHTIDQSTSAAFAESRLRMESSSGVVELSFSELSLFEEAYDPDNLVTLESSSYSWAGDELTVTWRFRVNAVWEDTAELRIYASLIADNGVNGLPGAVVLAPSNGNAIENDAMISSFVLKNNAGVEQNLTSATSNRNINLVGSIRLEGLDVAPDPTAYNLSLQRWDVQNVNGSVVSDWVNISNLSGVIGGDFDWNVDLGISAAGQATYRLMLDGYEGGDTLCPPAPIVSDADCAIPFNLSIDTYSPTLINISVLKASNFDQTIWSNWRNLVDDTWVLPSPQQKVRVLAQDIPAPPQSLDMYYWVQFDHDSDMDGIADPDEYQLLVLTSDGNLPTANYTGTYSDDANQGAEPPGKVSIYIEGTDLGGNAIDGGMPGFDNDLVTYVSMDAKTPNIRNFFIEDSDRNRLRNINEGLPFYQGPFNQTMYAGKEYHLIVEATDPNGWRDINWFEINLASNTQRDDLYVYYSPRNDTAWTDSDDIEIIEASNDSDGPKVVRMDGGRLIDPFEDEFYLDLPIRLNWNILGLANTMEPQLRIKDMDRDPSIMTEAGGRHKQKWKYSDDIQLDFRSGISPSFEDLSPPYSQDIEIAFVFPGDTVAMQGQYAYVDGINNGVYILPEGEFTLEITREEAMMDGNKGYFQYPAGGADGSKSDGPTLHTIDGGAFNISITAPPINNEYTYTFRLINLPEGATDSTTALCDGNSAFGCGSFKIKVDASKPQIDEDKWKATSGLTGDVLGNLIPSSTLQCVNVQTIIEENAALIAGEVDLKWAFYKDPSNNVLWEVYRQKFTEPMSHPLDVKFEGGENYNVSADCVDLWPDPVTPTKGQIENAGVDLVFWIEGRDSAGWSIAGGGPETDSNGITIVPGISKYRLDYQEAEFTVIDVRMTPKNPEVGDTPELEITLRNKGSKEGNITLEIQSVKDGGFPTTELTFTTEVIPSGETVNIFVTDFEAFAEPTSGMYYIIVESETNLPLWNGDDESKQFNVAQASDDEGLFGGSGMLIVVGLGTLILILLLVVVVLARRGSGDGTYEYEYEYEEEEEKSYADIPRSGPPSAGPPPASVDPLMAAALAEFPQWDQATIQGYFDQGWDIASLRDWVNNNQ